VIETLNVSGPRKSGGHLGNYVSDPFYMTRRGGERSSKRVLFEDGDCAAGGGRGEPIIRGIWEMKRRRIQRVEEELGQRR